MAASLAKNFTCQSWQLVMYAFSKLSWKNSKILTCESSLCKSKITFTNRKLHKDKLTFFPIFWLARNEIWLSKNFFDRALCPVTVQKFFWARRTASEITQTRHSTKKHLQIDQSERVNCLYSHAISLLNWFFMVALFSVKQKLFKKVVAWHCLGCVWGKKKKEGRAPTVKATVDQFNAVSLRVISSILTSSSSKTSGPNTRGKYICWWISVAQVCTNINTMAKEGGRGGGRCSLKHDM